LFYLLETSSPTCYQDHVKISNREREKSENILILGGKTGKYSDFGEKTGKYPDFVEKTGNYPDFYLRIRNIKQKSQI
jgi:hypothetical protein